MPKIASVRLAAVRLGAQATRDVLYQVAYASMFVDAPRFRDLIEATFEHGVRVGRTARTLARELRLDPDIAFLAGLLHDIGRARSWKLLASRRPRLEPAEAAAAVDQVHALAGAQLAATWHLPDEVVEVCRFHHDAGKREYPRLVAAADELARLGEKRADPDSALLRLLEAGIPSPRAGELLTKSS
jgi:putative nucleotidyltransferase with HDIG domain